MLIPILTLDTVCRLVRKAHELGSKDPNWRHPSAARIEQVRHYLRVEARYLAYLDGKQTATTVDELDRLHPIARGRWRGLARADKSKFPKAWLAMRRWLERPGFNAVRDAEHLARLPQDARKRWTLFWQKLRRMLDRL